MKSLLVCWSFYLVLLCTNPNVAASDTCETSTAGTNFMISVIGYVVKVSGTNINLHITTTDQTPAHVRVTVPFINLDNSYTVSNYTVIPLNGTLMQFEAGKQFKGIEVNSDVNISVTVVTVGGDIMEGYLALPVEALGTRYVAASYYPYASYSSEILIAGVENNTDVTLSTMLNGQVGSNRTFRLQKFETYQFKSNNDVSGSVIMSNKPVAVFSGSAAAQIPVGVGDFQFLIEQMIPVKFWATKFIIPPMYPREHFVVKILSHSNYTEVLFCNTTRHFAVNMKTRSVEEIFLGTAPVIVTSTTPVSVILYGYNGDNIVGDPYMLNAQGLTQFQSSYQFFTQNYYSGGSNTIGVTIRKADVSGLRLNGRPLSYWNTVNITVPQPMEEYVTMFVNVSYSSYYRLYHTGAVKFGAILYGRYSYDAAYGYPLQLTFTDPGCNYQAGSSPSSPSPTPSITTLAPSHSNRSFEKGNGTLCFHCDGMSSLKYCDQVQRCKHENEVCYVQRYPKIISEHLYNSGCINPERCNSGSGSSSCTECCAGDFCNTAGCGDKGFSTLEQRGPLCFDCTHKGENEDCSTVQLCHSNQACIVAKYEWGDNDSHYIMGCTDIGACSSKRAGSTRRHAPVCIKCCHSDFCNSNCTSDPVGPSIVG